MKLYDLNWHEEICIKRQQKYNYLTICCTYSDSSSRAPRLRNGICKGILSSVNSLLSVLPPELCSNTTSSRNLIECVLMPSLSLSIMFNTINWKDINIIYTLLLMKLLYPRLANNNPRVENSWFLLSNVIQVRWILINVLWVTWIKLFLMHK